MPIIARYLNHMRELSIFGLLFAGYLQMAYIYGGLAYLAIYKRVTGRQLRPRIYVIHFFNVVDAVLVRPL